MCVYSCVCTDVCECTNVCVQVCVLVLYLLIKFSSRRLQHGSLDGNVEERLQAGAVRC